MRRPAADLAHYNDFHHGKRARRSLTEEDTQAIIASKEGSKKLAERYNITVEWVKRVRGQTTTRVPTTKEIVEAIERIMERR